MYFPFTVEQIWDWMYSFAYQYGYFGAFIISFVGSMSIIFPIPYTIFIYLSGAFLDPFLLSIVCGLGSAVGEFSGYILGYYGQKVLSEERRKKMEYMVKFFDRYGSIAIFIFALTPLPDDLLFIPLGVMRYSFVKAFIPSLLGKSLMAFILAYSGRLSLEFIRVVLGEGGWITIVFSTILLGLILIIMLKIDWEKVFERYIAPKEERN